MRTATGRRPACARDVGEAPEDERPDGAPKMAAPVTQLVWSVLRCHCVSTRTAAVPMTNRP